MNNQSGGKSWFAKRWRVWRRWWLHPERDLARRQFRRGIGFWLRWPWNVALVFIVISQIMLLVAGFFELEEFLTSFAGVIIIVSSLVDIIAWANCLQDNGMNYFRGNRLGELLITPEGSRRFFPAILMAPIGTSALTGVISLAIEVAGILLAISSPRVAQAFGVSLIKGHAGLTFVREIGSLVVTFGTSVVVMIGMTSVAAAWTIGSERTIAVFKSVVGYVGVIIAWMVIATGVGLLEIVWRVQGANFIAWFLSVCEIVFGIILWRAGLKKLRSPKTIEKLQKAMESVK